MPAPPRARSDQPDEATVAVLRDARALPLPASIRVIDAPASPRSFRLRAGRCVVGAGERADVLVDHKQVSRAHVALDLVPEGVVVTDLGSRNGTFYLGQRVQQIVLALGSRIRLGTVEVAIDVDVDANDDVDVDTAQGDAHRGLIGVSPAMRSLFAVLRRLEGSLAGILVEGESGVGKELVARALHEGSLVASGPLVTLNCGAVARELVQSELFGHVRGSFTGALTDRIGAFEAAHEGTLFLDEIGELPESAQSNLLRALESGEIQRVGETVTRKVKVRIVAATNRDLESEVAAGRFRRDLFYRLAVVKIAVPPLRERPEDIPALARHFAGQIGLAELPPDVVAHFRAHTWPGNVRELRNAVQAYVALGTLPGAARPQRTELDAEMRKLVDLDRPYVDLKDEIVHRFTRLYLEMLLDRTGPNQSEAARVAGLDRGHLRRMLARYEVLK